jgi:hypothetical protein
VEQTANCLEICQDLLGRLEIELDFLDKVIIGNELCVFDYDPKTKWLSAAWPPKKFSLSDEDSHEQIQGESCDYCFFSSRGIVHKEFVSPGQTVNHTFYKDVFERKQVQLV